MDNKDGVVGVEKMLKNQPNLFLIGAMRAGSTSLHALINQHPEIFMSHVKEPMYYVAETMRRTLDMYGNTADIEYQLMDFVKQRKHAEAHTYEILFDKVMGRKYMGESSHYIYHPQVARAIHDDCPNARIIVSLRNPIERLYSEYMLYRRQGKDVEETFAEFVNNNSSFSHDGKILITDSPKIRKSLYFDSLVEWVNVFGRDQVKIILFEDFISDYLQVCESIFSWLGVDPTFTPIPIHAQQGGTPKSGTIFYGVEKSKLKLKLLKRIMPPKVRDRLRAVWYQVSLEKGTIDESTRVFLLKAYREDITNLEREFQLDLSTWV